MHDELHDVILYAGNCMDVICYVLGWARWSVNCDMYLVLVYMESRWCKEVVSDVWWQFQTLTSWGDNHSVLELMRTETFLHLPQLIGRRSLPTWRPVCRGLRKKRDWLGDRLLHLSQLLRCHLFRHQLLLLPRERCIGNHCMSVSGNSILQPLMEVQIRWRRSSGWICCPLFWNSWE